MALLTGKQYDEEKKRLYQLQYGICPICKRELPEYNKAHLDHDHAMDGPSAGKIRGLLCVYCNQAEGRTRHFFMRSGLAGQGVEYLTWLESLLEYLKRDYSAANTHPTYVADLKSKFKRLNKEEMIEQLVYSGMKFDYNMTKSELIKAYNKQIKKQVESDLKDR